MVMKSSGDRSIANGGLAVRTPDPFLRPATDPECLHSPITAGENGPDGINSCEPLPQRSGISLGESFDDESSPNPVVRTLNVAHGNPEGLDILAHAAETELSHQNIADKRSSGVMNCEKGEVHQALGSTSLAVQGIRTHELNSNGRSCPLEVSTTSPSSVGVPEYEYLTLTTSENHSSSIKGAFASGLGYEESAVAASVERTPGFQETSPLNPRCFSRKRRFVEIGDDYNSTPGLAAQTTDSGRPTRDTGTGTNTSVIEDEGEERRPRHMLDPSIVGMRELEVGESEASTTREQEVSQFYKNSNFQATLAGTNLQSDPTLSISLFSQIEADLTLQLTLFNNPGGIASDRTLSSALFAEGLLAL
ncbi:hypothetical protein CPC735_067770 [Coccidioides posadasii C735 delta SOWgp]|uniref:Uncharacterized protein n=1 Tax=Coccidioides posadasii (strain C735) TaxID=222929 RepID=C5PCK0_COCP7|nr:hypothetical protein CPC735_067770 [Coccidioides posadasii C735 delta SOWgp]EER25677.1 hypothetical protein CPC735_067770 [Coccidioides posadasii C735 delta SOWgp]|eukprot:XP_003067822.1 hypothetical protein CPC735_067770 [Coccidioides posadasii C735 delta SOWgp]